MKRLPSHRTSTHPGEVLREEFLGPLGLSPRELAAQIGAPPEEVEGILRGERAVDDEVAERLSRRFGTTQAFWLGLQDAHDRTRERDEDPTLYLPDDPIDDETLPADASTDLDRYLYGDVYPDDEQGRGR